MRKFIITDGENNDSSNTCIKCGKEIPEDEIYCDECSALLESENEIKPRFPRLSGNFMKDLPLDEEDDYEDDGDDEDEDEDEDEDDIDDSDMLTMYGYGSLPVARIVAGAVVIAMFFLIIGIFIGKNSKSAFIDQFDLHKEDTYIDVIEE